MARYSTVTLPRVIIGVVLCSMRAFLDHEHHRRHHDHHTVFCVLATRCATGGARVKVDLVGATVGHPQGKLEETATAKRDVSCRYVRRANDFSLSACRRPKKDA